MIRANLLRGILNLSVTALATTVQLLGGSTRPSSHLLTLIAPVKHFTVCLRGTSCIDEKRKRAFVPPIDRVWVLTRRRNGDEVRKVRRRT